MNRLFIFAMVMSFALPCQFAWGSDTTADFYEVTGSAPRYRLRDTDLSGTYWALANDYLVSTSFSLYYEDNDGSDGYPFVVETDSPTYLLYLDSNGRIGIKTSSPSHDLHIVDNVPEIRLEDSDVDGGKANIQMNGNELAFEGNDQQDIVEIDTQAPAQSLMISDVGELSSNWSGSETTGDGLKNLLNLITDNTELSLSSDAGFALRNERESFQWNFRTAEAAEGFMATKDGSGGPELEIKNATNDYRQVSLHLGNGAICNSNGQWLNASSRKYKDNIKELSGDEAMAAFAELQPVSYTFKKDTKKEPVLGFIAEDVPDLVATEERNSLNALELVALVTKVVQKQQKQIEEQQSTIQAQQMAIVELQKFQASINAQRPVQPAGYTSQQPAATGKGIARNL